MRSAYFVFDLANNQIAIAQAANSSSSSGGSVVAISSGTDIPGCSSTNTFSFVASSIASSEAGPDAGETSAPSASGTSFVEVTPTFDLGAAAEATGSGSGSASASGKHNAGLAVRVNSPLILAISGVAAGVIGFAMVLL
jgi:hypothetical protein